MVSSRRRTAIAQAAWCGQRTQLPKERERIDAYLSSARHHRWARAGRILMVWLVFGLFVGAGSSSSGGSVFHTAEDSFQDVDGVDRIISPGTQDVGHLRNKITSVTPDASTIPPAAGHQALRSHTPTIKHTHACRG